MRMPVSSRAPTNPVPQMRKTVFEIQIASRFIPRGTQNKSAENGNCLMDGDWSGDVESRFVG
jgi:hypothetical protein